MSGQKAAKSGRRPKATDAHELAGILEYARLHSDDAAAEKFGISTRTIRRHRKDVRDGKSPELAGLVQEQRAEIRRRNADLIVDTVDLLLHELQARKTKLTNEELIEAVEKVGQLRIQRDALNPHVESADPDQSNEGAEAGGAEDPGRAGSGPESAGERGGQVH